MTQAEGVRASIVVPVWRHWDLVQALVSAAAEQDLHRLRAELILVDDEAGERRDLGLPPAVRVVPGPGRGAYAARNAGVAAARGRLLIFTDADCRPRPGWLAAHLAAWSETPDALLAGPVQVVGAEQPNPFEIYEIVRGIPQSRYVAHGYAATANLAVPATIFHELGGFDEARRSGGDADFCRRARRRGKQLRLVSGAVVDHVARATWPDLVAKTRRVKGGQVASGSARHRTTWAARTLVPPVREIVHYMRSDHSAPHRRIAALVRLRLWRVELVEMLRLLGGAPPRR